MTSETASPQVRGFIAPWQAVALATAAKPNEERRRGYVIRQNVIRLTPAETKAREEATLKTLAEAMRKKKTS